MIIDILVPIVGFSLILLSADRTFLFQRLPLKKKRLSSAFICVGVIFFCSIKLPSLLLWLLIGSCALILRVFSFFGAASARDLSLEDALLVLDRSILSMKAGRSLRISLREAQKEKIARKLSRVLQSLAERIEHGGGFDHSQPLLQEILGEMRLLEKRGVRSIESLESFRSTLRLRLEFRRRSGQLTLQTRVQAVVAALLYLPLFLFQAHEGRFFDARTLFSLVLFLFSQIWIHFLYRSFKWTV